MTTPTIDVATAQDVVRRLDTELGDVDPDARAIVGVSRVDAGHVELTDVTLADNGVLEVPDGTAALVVVTSENLQPVGEDEVVPVRQLVCVLRDGTEVGLTRVGDDPSPRLWRLGEPAADPLRPRDLATNTARRALGLPSLTTDIPIEDLLCRLWLLQVVQVGLELFDQPDGHVDVHPDELARELASDPIATVRPDEACGDERLAAEVGWEDVRRAAAAGTLELGPYRVDPDHAAWLDADGFAQYVDQTVLSTDEMLGTLHVIGDDDLLGWAIGQLAERDWYTPDAA